MKKAMVLLLAVVCGFALWVTASAGIKSFSSSMGSPVAHNSTSLLDEGISYLDSHDLTDAVAVLQNAVAADPTNQEAQFYYAVARVAYVYQNPSAATTGTLKGVEQALKLCGLTFASFGVYDTKTTSGPAGLSSSAPTTGAAFTFLNNALLPQIEGAIANLGNVTSALSCPIPQSALGKTTGSPLTADYGDALVIQAGLYAAEGMLNFLLAYNLNVNPVPIVNTQGLDSRALFRLAVQQNSALLTPASPALLTSAETAFESAITTFQAAVTAIEARPWRPATSSCWTSR